jgi:trk system potassium uptake protein TrkH
VSIGSALVLATALGIVALDILVASPWTGLPVVLGMGLVTVAVAEQVRQLIVSRRTAGLAGVIWFEGSLLLALLGFLIARILVLTEMFEGATERQVAAAETYNLVFTSLAAIAGGLVIAPERSGRVLLNMAQKPATALIGSFAVMIAVGSLLLTLPLSVTELGHVSFVDALFTMTSAVCVTGLAVNDIGTTYSPFGQLVILLGIQFGGIGIMTLGAAALTLRRNPSLRTQAEYAELFEADNLKELRVLVRTVVTSTFAIELAGALCLAWIWRDDPRLEGRSLAWCSLFHAISAFCNAGFSLFPANLAPFVRDAAPQAVIALLVLLGGIGFPVYLEIGRRIAARARALLGLGRYVRRPFDLGPRVALQVSGTLLAGGALLIVILEWSGVLGELDAPGKLLAALFSSTVARTAGFNTVEIGSMRAATLLVVMALMWIGGSPSSTAGGIKTTAAAVLFATFVGETRGHEPRLGARALGAETVRRATAVAALGLATVGLTLFALCLTERHEALALAFESTSAFSTTGLSTGITPQLSTAGRVILVATMFVGRLGPMTVALAIGRARRPERFRLPSHEIAVW